VAGAAHDTVAPLPDQFERVRFKAWMGYVAGATLIRADWTSEVELPMMSRGLRMTIA